LAASRDDCLKKGSRRHQLFSEEHPIYEKCFRILWTHSFYSFQKEEISQLDEDSRRVLSSLLSAEQLDRLQREQGASFGWGRSSRIMDENNLQSRIFPNQWLEAVCVLEYYYSCFDIADTKLPVYIARARTRSIKGKHYEVLDSARGIRSALRIIINDYSDLRARAASEAHEAMEAYHQSWRVPDLFANLSKKFDLLEELIAVSSDAINKRAESAIQTILFIITLLSIIGLTSSLHQYLVGSYEGRFADPLHKIALSLGKGDLVIYSVVTVLAMIVIYLVYRFRRR
jgi:hypothetical protein